jgi:hypothetical protein
LKDRGETLNVCRRWVKEHVLAARFHDSDKPRQRN